MKNTEERPVAQRRLSCIIPAYNEQERIGAVIATVRSHPMVTEVIVVDDGSSDDTARIAQSFRGIEVVCLNRNCGKTLAVSAGVARASGDYVLLVDADLEGLCADDLTQLIAPVVSGVADMTMSLRRNAPWLWRMIGIDYISGERVMPIGMIFDRLADLQTQPRFGLETWLNRICVAERSRIAVVTWRGVDSPIKVKKYGLLHGIMGDVEMLSDILRSASPLGLIRQIMSMRRQRVCCIPRSPNSDFRDKTLN